MFGPLDHLKRTEDNELLEEGKKTMTDMLEIFIRKVIFTVKSIKGIRKAFEPPKHD
jgi:hypothetical protein